MRAGTLLTRTSVTLGSLVMLSGCAFLAAEFGPRTIEATPPPLPIPDPAAPRLEPLPTIEFSGIAADEQIIGDVQVIFTRYENTFVQIARQYDIGYEALRHANPAVDQWLPGEDTPVYLPTMRILPDTPRDGIVLNLPSMRLLFFTPEPDGAEAGASYSVTSHPIGIGREGWATPFGSATVIEKARDPTWYPPASVRAEHAALGDPLPRVVPPGPDNPLGNFALRLSMPGYLIHGTNKPAGVGMRVSHGCIRLYPEDIDALYDRVPTGTAVHIVDQPILAGWREGQLYLEVHPQLAEDDRDAASLATQVIEKNLTSAGIDGSRVDWEAVASVVEERLGIPIPILSSAGGIESYFASARIVQNLVPISPEQPTARR
jgi:L,D-transpeptidase ErfK/SrfK